LRINAPTGQAAVTSSASVSAGGGECLAIDLEPLVVPATDKLEDVLMVEFLRDAHAAPALDAPVVIEIDVGVGKVDRPVRIEVGELGCGDAEAVGQGLQFAQSALLAKHAVVVALDESMSMSARRNSRISAVSFSTTMPSETVCTQAAWIRPFTRTEQTRQLPLGIRFL
jgi:hypothetical protein